MIVGVPAESAESERRVAVVPGVVKFLIKAKLEVLLESGAGQAAGFPDTEYEQHGVRLTADRGQLFSTADILLSVGGIGSGADGGRDLLRKGQVVVALLNPLGAPEGIRELASKGVTAFALELLPRITRAQPMDVLSSMATVAGYKAALLAADMLQKMYPMMITAAGTITPARVFVIGAGVAGLQAIATSRRMGAVVSAYDVRPAVKEQVESLGAKFVELGLDTSSSETTGGYAKALGEEFYRRQQEVMAATVADSDVVITTAAIPGKKAPVLVSKDAVEKMRPGSVIVDLAAETGGNCELTRAGETYEAYGVSIVGPRNLPSAIPYHASQMLARNFAAFLQNLVKEGAVKLNRDDPVINDTLVAHEGEVVSPRVRELLGMAASAPARGAAGQEKRS